MVKASVSHARDGAGIHGLHGAPIPHDADGNLQAHDATPAPMTAHPGPGVSKSSMIMAAAVRPWRIAWLIVRSSG